MSDRIDVRVSPDGVVAQQVLDEHGYPTIMWLTCTLTQGSVQIKLLDLDDVAEWTPLAPFSRLDAAHEPCAEHAKEVSAIVAALVRKAGGGPIQISQDELAEFTDHHVVSLTRGDASGLKVDVVDLAAVERTTFDEQQNR